MSAFTDTDLQAIAGFAQVNLLEQTATDPQRKLPWWSPLAIVAVVGAAALASHLALQPRVDALKARAVAREAQLQQLTQLIETASRQSQGGSVADQVQALQAALARQQQLLVMLGAADEAPTRTTGLPPGAAAPRAVPTTSQDFSALLEGLSRTRVDGLWLTQVRLDRRTQEVRLEGQAQSARLVSAYIDDLTRNPRFEGLVLATVEVVQAPVAAAPVAAAASADAAAPQVAAPLARFRLASAVTAAPTGAEIGAKR